jgi:hypothetical protein
MRKAKALSDAGLLPPAQDFYGVLRDSAARGADEGKVFGRLGAPMLAPPPSGGADAAGAAGPLDVVPVRDD